MRAFGCKQTKPSGLCWPIQRSWQSCACCAAVVQLRQRKAAWLLLLRVLRGWVGMPAQHAGAQVMMRSGGIFLVQATPKVRAAREVIDINIAAVATIVAYSAGAAAAATIRTEGASTALIAVAAAAAWIPKIPADGTIAALTTVAVAAA